MVLEKRGTGCYDLQVFPRRLPLKVLGSDNRKKTGFLASSGTRLAVAVAAGLFLAVMAIAACVFLLPNALGAPANLNPDKPILSEVIAYVQNRCDVEKERIRAEEQARIEEEQRKAEEERRRIEEEQTRIMPVAWSADNTDFTYMPAAEKTIYLTFDDGPSELTPEVLDILDRYGVKATFFVTEQNPDSLHYIKEAFDRGHTIALHTASHDYATVYASYDAYFADLNRIGDIVENQIGFRPCLIRFPGGSSNTVSADYTPGIMSQLAADINGKGYQYFDWNVSVGDGAVVSADAAFENGTSVIGEQEVVLLAHDSPTKQTTVEALPRIIEAYRDAGYRFATLDRHSFAAHHGIGN